MSVVWKRMGYTVAALLAVALTMPAEEKSSDLFAPEPGGSSSVMVMEAGGSYLGVDLQDVTAERLGELKLKEERGAEVVRVDQDAPAGKAGIQEHDVILQFNGTQVESVAELGRMIRETPAGRTVSLLLSRDGQLITVKAKLEDRDKAMAHSPLLKKEYNEWHFAPHVPAPVMPAMPAMPEPPDFDIQSYEITLGPTSGVQVENLTPQLGDFFGVKNGEGVLVRSVEKGTPAEKAGFRAGDIIVKVNGEHVGDAGDFTRAVRSRDPGKDNTVTVNVIRDRKEQTLTLTIPSRKQSEIFEESFETPDLDAETQEAIAEADEEVARARPQMDLAVQEMERLKPEIEKAEKYWSEHREELQQKMEQMQQELEEKHEELQQKREEMEEKRQEIEQHRQELLQQQEEQRQELREQQEQLRQELRERQQELQEQLQQEHNRPAGPQAEI